ncbi:class I SAM-dependent methyltransferase [candidate division WOR-3 bacterium]|nr:class I SAM-dependent methyltransferase [candidate division WOR-3 bacterium]
MPKIKPFEDNTQDYENWFSENPFVYQSEIQAVKHLLPQNGEGVEIGVGSGKFAGPLGIKHGVEPSGKMRDIARNAGIDAVEGVAEDLPYEHSRFDFALMVTTICFLDDIEKSFFEVHRILKEGGAFIIGLIDRESMIGRMYQRYKNENVFYKIATFYSIDEVLKILEKTGFHGFEFTQTIFKKLTDIKNIEPVKKGCGEGSFVVVKALK